MVLNERRIQSKIRKRGQKVIRKIRKRFSIAIDKIPEEVGLDKKVGVQL